MVFLAHEGFVLETPETKAYPLGRLEYEGDPLLAEAIHPPVFLVMEEPGLQPSE